MSAGTHDIYTHSDTFGIVVDHYGDARGTKNQFRNSDPSAMDALINGNLESYHFATETLTPQLGAIRTALSECWQGSSAEHALGILTQLTTDASTIGTNTKACHDSFVTFQTSWVQLKGEAESLYEGVGGTGVHEDNSGAHQVFSKFTAAMTTSMHAMPAHLKYQDPLDAQHAGPGPGPGPGPGGPGPGPGGWGPGPGSFGPGGPGPGGWGPGKTNPGGPGQPGGFGPGAPGSPGSYTGGNGGLGPGAGLDTGSQLSSYTGGGMGPGGPGFGGPGPGFGGPGPGAPGPGAVSAAGLASTESALSAEAGISGVGAQEAAAGGRPMMGGRGGGAGSDEEERDRTTWLSEEEGIWDGETGAPPGTIA